MNNFSSFDFICLILIIIFTIRCSIRGFISEVMSMASVTLGLLAALYFFRKGGSFIRDRFMPGYKTFPEVIAFIVLFFIVFIIMKIMERLLKEIVQGIKLGKVDRFIGIFFGFVEGVIVVSLVIFIISIQPLFDPQTILNNSFFARIILPYISGNVPDATEMIIERSFRGGGSV